jgi:hypothetical protein
MRFEFVMTLDLPYTHANNQQDMHKKLTAEMNLNRVITHSTAGRDVIISIIRERF